MHVPPTPQTQSSAQTSALGGEAFMEDLVRGPPVSFQECCAQPYAHGLLGEGYYSQSEVQGWAWIFFSECSIVMYTFTMQSRFQHKKSTIYHGFYEALFICRLCSPTTQ